MDTAHRDRLAFIRICSGVFERGMVVTHARTGRPFATKYAQHVFGRERESIDVAYPGDVVGLVNAAALGVGDTLYAERPVTFPPLTTFAPEHFAVCRGRDTAKHKQFRRGHRAAGLRGRRPGAAVGPPRRPGAGARRRRPHAVRGGHAPHGARVRRARSTWTGCPTAWRCAPTRRRRPASRAARGAEVLQRTNGELLAVFSDKWGLRVFKQKQAGPAARAPGRRPALSGGAERASLDRARTVAAISSALQVPGVPRSATPRRRSRPWADAAPRASRPARPAGDGHRADRHALDVRPPPRRGTARRRARRPAGRASAPRRDGGAGGRLGGPHQRQRQPLGLDLDQRDVGRARRAPGARRRSAAAPPTPRRGRRRRGRPRPRRRRRPARPRRPAGSRRARSAARRQVSCDEGVQHLLVEPVGVHAAVRVDGVQRVLEAARPGVAEVEPAVLVAAERQARRRPAPPRSARWRRSGRRAQVVRLVGHARPPRRRPRRSAPASARAAPRG